MSSAPMDDHSAANNFHFMLMCGVLIVGVFLVCFANPIGIAMVKEKYAANSYQWSPDKAKEVASTIRYIGAMLFTAGLVERLVLQIAKLKA